MFRKISTRAFTLTELMVVIIIIGILSAVAVPAYKKYLAHSRTSEAYAIMSDIQKSQIVHHNENSYFVSLVRNPEDFPNSRIFSVSSVGWSMGWGGPFIKSPLTDGTQLMFNFSATAGSELGQFDITSGADDDSGYSVYLPLSDPSVLFFDPGKASQNCVGNDTDFDDSVASELTPENLGIVSTEENDWVILLAQGDVFGDNQCRYLYSILKASANNSAGMVGGFVLIDRDYNVD